MATNFFTLTLICFSVITSSISCFLSAEDNAPQQIEQLQKEETAIPLSFGESEIQEVSYWKEFSRMMMILGTILGIVLLIAYLLRNFLNKRIKQVNQSNIIKVIERRNLSQKSMVYLIEVYNKQFLLGDSAAGGIEFLTECEPDETSIEDVEPPAKTSKFSFIEILQRKLSEKQLKPTNQKL